MSEHIPLRRATLCANCESVFDGVAYLFFPACASASLLSLGRVLDWESIMDTSESARKENI